MAVALPNGAQIFIASTYGAAKTMSVISNATEAVATLEASHGVVENDILEITSGWSKLSGRIVRADSVATNDVTLEDINTSSTTKFPAGGGVGTVREITAWTQITQVMQANSDGGEQQFATYRFLEDSTQRRIPTFRNAQGMTLAVGDDDSLAHWAVLVAAEDDKLVRAIKIVLPSGDTIYHNAFVTFDKTPSLTMDEVMACAVTLSFTAEVTRYAA